MSCTSCSSTASAACFAIPPIPSSHLHHHQKFKLVDDDDDEYVRKMLNQLHVKSIARFFFSFPLSIRLQLNPS
jgi:hypothetical protein